MRQAVAHPHPLTLTLTHLSPLRQRGARIPITSSATPDRAHDMANENERRR